MGILGGMGPEATLLLQQRLLEAVPARDDADHVPLLIDLNTQVPSRIAHLIEGAGPDPAPVLAAMARRLEAAGASALAMPCNTAHHYAPAIRAAVGVPLLDMVALSAAALPPGPVGVLASPATRRIGLWEAVLPGRCLWPEDEAAILGAIRAVKRGERRGPSATLAAACAELGRRGARSALVGCSEFSLLARTLPPRPPPVDSLDLLVGAVLEAAAGRRPAPGAAP